MNSEIEIGKPEDNDPDPRQLDQLCSSAFLNDSLLFLNKITDSEVPPQNSDSCEKQSTNQSKVKIVYRVQQSVKKRRKQMVKNSMQKIVASNKPKKQQQFKRYRDDHKDSEEIKTWRDEVHVKQHRQTRNLYSWQSLTKQSFQEHETSPTRIIFKKAKLPEKIEETKKFIEIKETFAKKNSFLDLDSFKNTKKLKQTKEEKLANNRSCQINPAFQIINKTNEILSKKKQLETNIKVSPQNKLHSRSNYRAVSQEKKNYKNSKYGEVTRYEDYNFQPFQSQKQASELTTPASRNNNPKNFDMYKAKHSKISIKEAKGASSFHGNYVNTLIKKHKAENMKEIERKLRSTMSRCVGEFQKLLSVRDFNRKCGNKEEAKVFIFNSQDEYIRKILIERGWVQNPSVQSPFFHFKWTHMPSPSELTIKVQNTQLQNHFKNSFELTSKSYLTKNLKASKYFCGNCDKYYPKCFDIGNSSECQEFIEQYRHNIMMIFLQKLYQFCEKKAGQVVQRYTYFYRLRFKRDLFASDFVSNKKYKMKSKFIISDASSDKNSFRKIWLQDFKNPQEQFKININIIFEALKYWRYFRKKNQQPIDQYAGRSVETSRNRGRSSPKKTRNISRHALQFNKLEFLDHFTQFNRYLEFGLDKPKHLEQNFQKEMYSTPSELLIQRICKQYEFCVQFGALEHSYGDRNIWIVKPSSTSRGSGIFLTNNLSNILSSSKNIQSRIVQKYIERPLIIKNSKYELLHERKFDIRQWVLIKSIEPLEIYMFSHCYLRICHGKYPDLANPQEDLCLSDTTKHLTNYSINKHKYGQNRLGESVLPIDYLINYLQKEGEDWSKIKQGIKDIIIKSIQSCRESLQESSTNNNPIMQQSCSLGLSAEISNANLSRNPTNFQLLGFDILIDQNFSPWLLEVNMSPACEERTEWLSEYLQKMGSGLLDLVLPQQLAQNQVMSPQKHHQISSEEEIDEFLDLSALFLQITDQPDDLSKEQKKIEWELIYTEPNLGKKRQLDQRLQVIGTKVELKRQRIVDFTIKAERAARIIQRFMKKYVPLYKQFKRKKEQSIEKVSNYLNSFKTCSQYSSSSKIFYSQAINKYFISFIYQKEFEKKSEKTNILKINNFFQTFAQTQLFPHKLNTHKSNSIQSIAYELLLLRKISRQCSIMSQSLIQNTQKVKMIQKHIKIFLNKTKQNRSIITRYLKTYVNAEIIYPIKLSQNRKINFTNIIFNYLKTSSTVKVFENLKKARAQKTLSRCLKCLISRREWYEKRINIFYFILGRIFRVKKRRIRGEIFLQWKQEKVLREKQNKCEIVSQYMRGFLAIRQMKLNNK